jgi:hypothetical protein
VVHDTIWARLRKHFDLTGRKVSILTRARDLGTTRPERIQTSFADQNRDVPTDAMIHAALDPPVRFTHLKDPPL